MTVYITNSSLRFDYSPARKHGDLVEVTSRVYSFNSSASSPVNAEITDCITDFARQFKPEVDFVLPSGSAISTAMCFTALAAVGKLNIPVLSWNSNDREYFVGHIDLRPLVAKLSGAAK